MEELTPKSHHLFFKPTTQRILNLVRKKEMNISELSKELNMAYNNTFANVKNLEGAGLIELKVTGEQNNPSIIIPLVSEDKKFEFEKIEINKLKLEKSEKERIAGVFITIRSKGGMSIEKHIALFKELRNIINHNIKISAIRQEPIEQNKNEVILNFIYSPEKTSKIYKPLKNNDKNAAKKP